MIGAEEAHSSFLGDGSKVHGFAYVCPEREGEMRGGGMRGR